MFRYFIVLILFPVFTQSASFTDFSSHTKESNEVALATANKCGVSGTKVMEELECVDKGKGRFKCSDELTWCNPGTGTGTGKCECIFGYHAEEVPVKVEVDVDEQTTRTDTQTEIRCVPCLNDSADYGNMGAKCKAGKHWMCSTGYCAKDTKKCTPRIKDGEMAEKVGLIVTKESCISGEHVCGRCGKTVKEGQACLRSHNCEEDQYCKVTYSKVRKLRMCNTSTCQKCPSHCGKGAEPKGCHWPINKFGSRKEENLECGKLSIPERFTDLGNEIKRHLKSWGQCFKQILTRNVTASDDDSDAGSQPAKLEVAVKASGVQTCVDRPRDTGERYKRRKNCDHVMGPARKKKDPDQSGGFCVCEHGNYWDAVKKACVSCPEDEDPGDNNGDPCSTNEDCSSGKCSGNTLQDKLTGSVSKGECIKNPDTCRRHIRQAMFSGKCNLRNCDVTIGKPCLGLDRFLKYGKNLKLGKDSIEENMDEEGDITSTVSGKAELGVVVDGAVDVEGYAEANLLIQTKKKLAGGIVREKKKHVTARLRDVKLEMDATVELNAKVEAQYNFEERKIPLMPKQQLFWNVFMAGPVPIVVHIWCQPVLYVSFNAFITAEAKAGIKWKGTIAFKEDPEIMVDLSNLKKRFKPRELETGKSSVTTKGLTKKNIVKTGGNPEPYWDMQATVGLGLKVRIGVIFSVMIEGLQLMFQPGMTATFIGVAHASAKDNAVCGDKDGPKGGLSIDGAISLDCYILGSIGLNPTEQSISLQDIGGEDGAAGDDAKFFKSLEEYRDNGGEAKDMVEVFKEQLQNRTDDQSKGKGMLAKGGVKLITADVKKTVQRACNAVFGKLAEFFEKRYDKCAIMVEYKEMLCKALQHVVSIFTLGGKFFVGVNFFSFKFTWIIGWMKIPKDKQCVINWGKDRLQLGPGTKIEERVATPSVATNTLLTAIVTGFSILAILISMFVYMKYQEGDSYLLLLEEVALDTNETI